MNITELSSDIFSDTEATGDRNPAHIRTKEAGGILAHLAAPTLGWLPVKKTGTGIALHPPLIMSLPTGFLLSSTTPSAISEISYHLAFISILKP